MARLKRLALRRCAEFEGWGVVGVWPEKTLPDMMGCFAEDALAVLLSVEVQTALPKSRSLNLGHKL